MQRTSVPSMQPAISPALVLQQSLVLVPLTVRHGLVVLYLAVLSPVEHILQLVLLFLVTSLLLSAVVIHLMSITGALISSRLPIMALLVIFQTSAPSLLLVLLPFQTLQRMVLSTQQPVVSLTQKLNLHLSGVALVLILHLLEMANSSSATVLDSH